MIATIINAIAIIVGTILGLVMRKGFSERAKEAVFNATGIIALTIGISMAITTSHVLAFALSMISGGLIGTALDIEGAIYRLGEWLRRRFARKPVIVSEGDAVASATAVLAGAATVSGDASLADTANVTGPSDTAESGSGFAYGFLNASVLFCVGAMALVGSFKAGTEGDYDLILTKSVMDGVVAIIFAGAMGIGVGFSALSVLLYQGALTLAAGWIKPYVSETMISELTAVGGALIIMIGINLLGLKKIRTGDFLPSIVVIVALSFLFEAIPVL